MSQPFRLDGRGRVDRQQPLSFRFDGTTYTGYAGDTLASALLANGVHLVGRSFKYHRPRGILAVGAEEPNALVELRTGARVEPNTRATQVELFDGLVARSQNHVGTRAVDLMAVNQWFAPFLKAGFYYKTFMGPGGAWERLWEPIIRRAAGLGRAPRQPDPDAYEHAHLHCDVLVVGGGPAGLAAADAARCAGARVVLCEQEPRLGGALLGEIDSLAPWVDEVASGFDGEDARLLGRTSVVGYYDHGVLAAVERVADHLPTPPEGVRQRLWIIRAGAVVLATGSYEQPLLFQDNDRPGIMLASAARRYLLDFGVAPCRQVVVATATDDAYRAALDLVAAGVAVPTIADVRAAPGPFAKAAEAAGIEVLRGAVPLRALGRQRVRGLEVSVDGSAPRRLEGDALLVSGGFQPALQLASQAGAKARFDPDLNAFVPREPAQNARLAGAARGVFRLDACLADGREAGASAARDLGFALPSLPPLPAVDEPEERPWPAPLVPRDGKRAFVDLQNDVTVADLRLAVQEGYRAAEHAKRYTTLGMGTDQGKTAMPAGLAVLAAATGRPLAELAPTTMRPPVVPVAIGVLAGRTRGRDFRPIRRSALHDWHERNGAVFVEAGDWLRPSYYRDGALSLMEAAAEEAMTVRRAVGICDVSTLGKIALFGPDARTFLDRVYANGFAKLPVGKARYGVMLREDGIVFDDGTTSCLADDRFLMTTTTANAGAVLEHLEFLHQTAWPELDVVFCSETEQWCQMALAGPRSRDVLARLLDGVDVGDLVLPFMGFLEAAAEGVPVRVFRISFSGELAYELACPRGYGEGLWQRCLDVGAAFGIRPYGVEVLSILRIEKGHPAGQEIDGRTTAGDLGLGRLVERSATGVGKPLASRRDLTDPGRPQLVGLRPVDPEARLRGGAHLVENPMAASTATDLGWISSAHWSPHVGSWIALAFVAGGVERFGDACLWAVFPLRNEAVEVVVGPVCFVDAEGSRLRG